MASRFSLKTFSVLRFLPDYLQLRICELHADIEGSLNRKNAPSLMALPPELRTRIFSFAVWDELLAMPAAKKRSSLALSEYDKSLATRSNNPDPSVGQAVVLITLLPLWFPTAALTSFLAKRVEGHKYYHVSSGVVCGLALCAYLAVLPAILLLDLVHFLGSQLLQSSQKKPHCQREPLPSTEFRHELLAWCAMFLGLVQAIPLACFVSVRNAFILAKQSPSQLKAMDTRPNDPRLKLPTLTLNHQLSSESVDVLYKAVHLSMPSRRVLTFSRYPAFVHNVRTLIITESRPEHSIFTDPRVSADDRWDTVMRLLGGEKLRNLIIDIEPFYTPERHPQDMSCFWNSLGPTTVEATKWKCTELGKFVRPQTPSEQWSPLPKLSKIHFEHRRLQRLWNSVLRAPFPRTFDPRNRYNRYPETFVQLSVTAHIPRPAELEGPAIYLLLLIKYNIRKVQLGMEDPFFFNAFKPGLARLACMPGQDARFLEFWTRALAVELADVYAGRRTGISRKFLFPL